MDRRPFTPTRLIMVLLIVGLALGIGLAVAQTQSAAQPSADTPKSVAQTPEAAQPSGDTPGSAAEKPADTPETPAATAEAAEAPAEAAVEDGMAQRTLSRMRGTTQAQREAAAKRNAKRRADAIKKGLISAPASGTLPCTAALGTPCMPIDYFGTIPHYALSQLPTVTQTSIDPALPKTYSVTPGTGIRKFMDTLPGLGPANASTLGGQFIPIASPMLNPWDPTVSDYYEIGLKDYTKPFHSNLPATTQVRGYYDMNPTPFAAFGNPNDTTPHYLGPVIIAQGGTDVQRRPVRIKFVNQLAANSIFFIPADTSYMGMNNMALNGAESPYSNNRATLHLHGGTTPWISDGTPHQWTVPVAEYATEVARTTSDGGHNFARGVSAALVPDMCFLAGVATSCGTTTNHDPGPGMLPFYYTNAQSGRLMFYHDHALGLTRTNVYAGEAAGYLLHDPTVDALIGTAIPSNAGADKTELTPLLLVAAGLTTVPGGTVPLPGGLYHFGIPLVIQDKTFVPNVAQLALQDPSWNWGEPGNLWFPHVYMPNQNPNDDSGATQNGRWDYGPWFWPPMTSADLAHGQITCLGPGDTNPNPLIGYGPTAVCPGTRNPSGVPEAFMDTPVVNGIAYPTITVPQGAYRFQILNAANDRMFNMSLFYAADGSGNVCNPAYTGLNSLGGANSLPATGNCTEVKTVAAVPHPLVVPLPPAETTPDVDDTIPACDRSVQPDVIRGDGFLVTANPLATDYNPVTGLPGGVGSPSGRACWPSSWPTDGRDGGVPDPATAGPAWVQIGTEGGVLPQAVVIPPTPVGYNYNRRDIVVTNVQEHALFLGPAERADVIVDFSQVAPGSSLILYNDSPAPVPGYDVRLDYYTGAPDLSSTGGAPLIQAGYGPNIRTMMQINVVAGTAPSYMTGGGLAALQLALPGVFQQSQPHIIIPQTTYPAAALIAGASPTLPAKSTYARIQNTQGLTYTPINAAGTGYDPAVTTPLEPKAIHELFEVDYGKMNSILAAEIPVTNFNNQTTLPLAYVDPPTEIVAPGETQLWKVTHNGVDSHAMHFHLFDVQLINRVGWDGAIRPPDPNELGWKETVRMNPLEDAIVALRPIKPPIPFTIPESSRLLDPTRAIGATNTVSQPGFSNNDPNTGNQVNTVNAAYDYGWEYVWHCHLLGHEESDMMRPIVFKVLVPNAPTALAFTINGPAGGPNTVTLTWSWAQGTGGVAQSGFMVQRQLANGGWLTLPAGANISGLPLTIPGGKFQFIDTTVAPGSSYFYRVFALSLVNTSQSAASNVAGPVVIGVALAAPTNLRQSAIGAGNVTVAWTDTNTAGATGFTLQRCAGVGCSNFTTIVNTAITTFQYRNTGLVRGTTYTYRVFATGPAGAVSPFSNLLTVIGQ